jgi:hypothetical protein
MISAKKLINPAKIMYAMPPDQGKLAGLVHANRQA